MNSMSRANKLYFYEYDKEVAAAFKLDCEEFLEEFDKMKSFKFTVFQKVWHLKNFTFVFAGQTYALLLKELCENCFYVVKKFMMLSDSVFTQIGAFYLLYGLYYKQPLRAWVKIRLTLEEYKKMVELMELMKSKGEFEPVFIFAKMRSDQVFLYTALPKALGPEDRFIRSSETYLDVMFSSSKKHAHFMKFNEIVSEGDLVNDIEETNNEYQELMKKYAAKSPGLVPFSSSIIKDLQDAQKKVQGGPSSDYLLPSEEATRRTSVRKKAMANKNAVYRGKKKVKMAMDLDVVDTAANHSKSTDDEM